MVKFITLSCLLYLSCASISNPNDQCFDYSGTAKWIMSSDSLKLYSVSGNFDGTLSASIDSESHVIAVMTGTLTAPLMENKFTWTGSVKLTGILTSGMNDFELVLTAPADTLELYWNINDDLIWYTGSACR